MSSEESYEEFLSKVFSDCIVIVGKIDPQALPPSGDLDPQFKLKFIANTLLLLSGILNATLKSGYYCQLSDKRSQMRMFLRINDIINDKEVSDEELSAESIEWTPGAIFHGMMPDAYKESIKRLIDAFIDGEVVKDSAAQNEDGLPTVNFYPNVDMLQTDIANIVS